MDHKNQNDPPPDYSFILNQAGSAPAKTKKTDKKLVIIGALLGLIFVIFIAGILLSAKHRVVSNNSNNSNSFTPATRQTTVTDVPAAFLNYINTNKDTEAAALMNTDLQKGQANGTFANSIGTPFRQNIDLPSCVKDQGTDANNVTYTCKTKTSPPGSISIAIKLGSTSVSGKQTQEITKLTWSVKK